jgi:nucleoside-diphosphate-sugar epimerase
MAQKVLITGGAGYIGSTLISRLGNYDVTVFDNLLHGGDALIPHFSNVNFHFVKGDVRDERALYDAMKDKDIIVHLAAIVGIPACEADRDLAEQTNYKAAFHLAIQARWQRVIYASTVSVYGKVEGEICTERTHPRPLSHYGQTKRRAEGAIMDYVQNATAFRFPTVFGVSPRMRFDLMVNDLTYQAVKNGGGVVYEPDARRTFIHVRDAARAIEFAIDRSETVGNVYNPGHESLNISKRNLAALITKETGARFHFADIGHDGDHRDYEVSFEKIRSLGYQTTVTLEQGVKEVAQAAQVVRVRNPYANV